MHLACLAFIEWTANNFPEYLDGNIAEFGSHDVNGEIRSTIGKRAKSYIGIDWREGRNVDVVCFAHQFRSETKFRTIVSTSMLEHDPYWALSIVNMVLHLEKDGMLVLTWGAAKNRAHNPEHAVDGQFHPLRAEFVQRLLEILGMHILVMVYDSQLPFFDAGGGDGEINLIAFNGALPAKQSIFSELFEEDRLGHSIHR